MTVRQPMQAVTILGATGSIGQSTLDVLSRHPQRYSLYAVTAHSNVKGMLAIAQQYHPKLIVMSDRNAAQQLREALLQLCLDIPVEEGEQALEAVAACSKTDVVMAAIVGAAGLLPTFAAIQAGKKILLANKEALVMTGQIFMQAAQKYGAQLLPVDSEHNAIFQSLPKQLQILDGSSNLGKHGVSHIILTGSGGPFRHTPLEQISTQTPQAACAHPNWSMGQKISVDSATMINKGLEYIEARWLFNCQPSEIQVVIHPQSIIHSMVQYKDGSVLAQMGQPDMRTPIAHCLAYPDRIESGVKPLDFLSIRELTFERPDERRYPCLQLAQEACWSGQAATTTLNAANEIAVDAFLKSHIPFGAIAEVCEEMLQQHCQEEDIQAIESVLACDQQVRRLAKRYIQQRWPYA